MPKISDHVEFGVLCDNRRNWNASKIVEKGPKKHLWTDLECSLFTEQTSMNTHGMLKQKHIILCIF